MAVPYYSKALQWHALEPQSRPHLYGLLLFPAMPEGFLRLCEPCCLYVDDLRLDDINLRYYVIRKFTEHTDKVLKMILQNGSKDSYGTAFISGFIYIFIKPIYLNSLLFPAGGWIDYSKAVYGTDIISLYAFQTGKKYRVALHEIYDAFNNKEFFDGSKNETKWHVQQKNPISIGSTESVDQFWSYFRPPASVHFYRNRHGRIIGVTTKFLLSDGSNAEIFYTIWRQHKSEEEKCVALFPEKPYMIYNQHLINENTSTVHFVADEPCADFNTNPTSQQYGFLVHSACPGGLHNILDADFYCLSGKNIVCDLPLDGSGDIAFIGSLKTKCRDARSLEIKLPDGGQVISDAILSNPGEYGFESPAIEITAKTPGFADVGEELSNADRPVKILIDPIIESGTITWLFAAEKVGKTLMGLSIAYAAGKGNRPIGAWRVEKPCKVLYIDGEMPGNKLTDLINKVMIGYGDTNGAKSRPFALYSFYESGLEYDSILDEDWQCEWNHQIDHYDLIILDNYYSLNENRIDVKPFIKWLKSHTRNGVAFLVLDHTNSEGELQGSLIKKRAADLGILLEKISSDKINVSYQFDRYGVESKSSPHTLVPYFVASEFRLGWLNEASKEPKTLNDKLLLYAYLLTLQDKYKKSPTEIVSETGMRRATVDNYLNAFRPEGVLSEPKKKSMPKITPEDQALVHEEKERLMLLTNDELAQKLDYLKDSDLSRLFQS